MKKQNNTSGFEKLSRKYAELAACSKRAEGARVLMDQLFLQTKRLNDEHMFKWLIERASDNFRKQLSSDNPRLLLYFTSLFKERGYSFADTSGVSGFPLPQSIMRVVKGTKKDQELIPGLKGKVRRIIHFGHCPSVSVHALNIYRGPEDRSDQNSTLPTIALVVKYDGIVSNSITQKNLATCRVALLGGSHLDNLPHKPDFCFPGNQDYMLKLVELCTPETMFDQVFKYHGPAKID